MASANDDSANPAMQFKSFVSETELDEKRKQRQEEWEKVRQPDQPLEAPEEEYDHRSLYDRLQEQKDKKQEEYDEAHRMRNQVKGLESDEVEFLDYVSDKQAELTKKREQEDSAVLKEYKDALVVDTTKEGSVAEKRPKRALPEQSHKKSQMSLLAGAVKRKSVDSNAGESTSKRHKEEEKETPSEHDEAAEEVSSGPADLPLDEEIANNDSPNIPSTAVQTAQVLGVLPGLGFYSDSSDSDEYSSDSDDLCTDIFSSNCQQVAGHR